MNIYTLFKQNPVFCILYNCKIPAGFPSPALDYLEERIDLVSQLSPRPLSTFYVRSEGLSMIDACIPPHSILTVDRSLNAKSGDIVLAFIEGGFTIKFIKLQNNKCFLVPANKNNKYPTVEITADMEMVVWGVVTNIIIDTKNLRSCMP